MNKSVIKILERDKKGKTENSQPSTVSTRGETNNQFNVAHTISNWIAERRENSRAEKAASQDRIAAWRMLSEISKGY